MRRFCASGRAAAAARAIGRIGTAARRGDALGPSPDRHTAVDGVVSGGEGLAIEPGEVVRVGLPDLFSGSPLLILRPYRGRRKHRWRSGPPDSGRGVVRVGVGHAPRQPSDRPSLGTRADSQVEDRYAAGDGDRPPSNGPSSPLSLKFQVLCRFTAYVAVDRSADGQSGGSLHQVTQPVEMPEG